MLNSNTTTNYNILYVCVQCTKVAVQYCVSYTWYTCILYRYCSTASGGL